MEERLQTAESLVADGDLLAAVGQLVALLERRRRGRGDERVAALVQDLHQVVGQIATGQVATGQVEAMNGVCNSIALVNGHRVRDTVAEHRRKDGPRRIVAREARLALPEPVSIINAVET